MAVQDANLSSDPPRGLRQKVASRQVAAVTGVLLLIQASLLVHSAKIYSPTWDEVGHLAAGVSHWQRGRFDLYSVNPPLIRTIAAAPIALIAKPGFDWSFDRSAPSLRSEALAGRGVIGTFFFYTCLALIPLVLLGWLALFPRGASGQVHFEIYIQPKAEGPVQ